MTAFVAFLRGINVGGARKIGMADLRDVFARLGHSDVRTYVQSGNVVFRATGRPASGFGGDIEARIAADLGEDVTVLVRSAGELEEIVGHNPFVALGRDPKALHTTLLAAEVEPDRVEAVASAAAPPEELRVVGTTVYLHLPNGSGRTKLNNAFFERRLAVRATTRNWKTMTALLDLARE